MNINISSTNMNVTNNINDTIFGNRQTDNTDSVADMLQIFDDTVSSPAMGSTSVSGGGYQGFSESSAEFADKLAVKAQLAKDNLVNLFNRLTVSDVKEMDKSELGNINDDDVDKVLNVVEEIKIMLATYCRDYIPTGDVDMEEIKEFTGNAGMAAKVMKKFSDCNIPATRENVYEAVNAVKEYQALKPVDENAKRYLLKNEMEPTMDNLYKAEHSAFDVSKAATGISDKDFNALMPQIENVIKEAGFDVDEASLANAKMLLDEGVGLTKENLMLASDIDNVKLLENEDEIIDMVAQAFLDSDKCTSVSLSETQGRRERVLDAADVLKNASASDIIRLTNELRELNIANLAALRENRADAKNSGMDASDMVWYDEEKESRYQENFAVLNKARLVLGAGTLFRMDKLGIDIRNTSLGDMVQAYRESDTANDVKLVVSELADTPVNALYATFGAATFTMEDTVNAGNVIKWQALKAGEAYETFGTAIRGDMGDSLNKAVNASAGEMLLYMGMEADRDNVAAVKILAANAMEVTPQNVEKMAEDYRCIINIAANLTPQLALDMIRNKINPLTTDVHTLDKYITDSEGTVKDEESRESFAKFLYKLETKGEISEEERQDYIGFYKVLRDIAKDEGRSIGAVFAAGDDYTLQNVVRQLVSRKHRGMDAAIGEDTSYTVRAGDMSYYTKLFNDCVSLEESEIADDYYKSQADALKQAAMAEESIIRLLTDNDEPVTVGNIAAAMDVKDGKIYRKLHRMSDEEVESAVENIYENMSDEDRLKEGFAKLEATVSEMREKVYASENVTFAAVKDVDGVLRSSKLLNSLAKKREYNIPVYTKNGMVNVSLKLVSGETSRMSLSFESSETGRVGINCKAERERVDVFALSDSEEGVRIIEDESDSISRELKTLGFNEVNLNTGKSDVLPELFGNGEESDSVSSARLYGVAKIFISHLVH